VCEIPAPPGIATLEYDFATGALVFAVTEEGDGAEPFRLREPGGEVRTVPTGSSHMLGIAASPPSEGYSARCGEGDWIDLPIAEFMAASRAMWKLRALPGDTAAAVGRLHPEDERLARLFSVSALQSAGLHFAAYREAMELGREWPTRQVYGTACHSLEALELLGTGLGRKVLALYDRATRD
jgi:hypothetical protein